MTTWADFVNQQPDLAERVRAAFAVGKHATMATLRADGSPRISGTEVVFNGAEGRLEIGSMPGARKAADLLRDPRLAIHSPTVDPPSDNPSQWDGEAKLAGRAIHDLSVSDHTRFAIDIGEVVFTEVTAANDKLRITMWHPDRGLRVVERS